MNESSRRRDAYAAVREFETRCRACRRILRDQRETSQQILAAADDQLGRLLGLESGRLVWGWAGCTEEDSPTTIDEKIMRTFLRRALPLRCAGSGKAEMLFLMSVYLYTHERLHPHHPSDRRAGPGRFDPAVELLGIKGVALALFVEALDWDAERVLADLARASSPEGGEWLPPDAIFDPGSPMLHYVIGRKWLAEELFLKWMEQHDRVR